jgi:hypothetical protein
MPDPLYSDRWTQMFLLTPSPGPLTGPTLPQRNAPAGNITTASGFMVDVAGTITIEPAESTVPVTIPVQPGVQYHIAFKRLLAMTTVTTVWGAR